MLAIGNYFEGAGDELCDLGGDVYLSENVFLNVFLSFTGGATIVQLGPSPNLKFKGKRFGQKGEH